jgi:formamidopyrimidine-DNA glycosylase
MPELPDVTVYLERLTALCVGQTLQRIRVASPFVVRTYDPPISSLSGKQVESMTRIGKRIVFDFEGDVHLVIHLMIAGRLRLRPPGTAIPKKLGLCAFDFPSSTILFTEAGTQKRASIHVVGSKAGLADFDRGGIEPMTATLKTFKAALTRENRTMKRALTDPRLVSGIGNAYSDEILFDAKLSPVKLTSTLGDDEIRRLLASTKKVLTEWIDRLRDEAGDGFPEKVTAFHDEMNVHGRYGKPCNVCGTRIQRIRYASNEVNYCPECQTGGKLLADRGLSRLLKGDWPKSIEELDERLGRS